MSWEGWVTVLIAVPAIGYAAINGGTGPLVPDIGTNSSDNGGPIPLPDVQTGPDSQPVDPRCQNGNMRRGEGMSQADRDKLQGMIRQMCTQWQHDMDARDKSGLNNVPESSLEGS